MSAGPTGKKLINAVVLDDSPTSTTSAVETIEGLENGGYIALSVTWANTPTDVQLKLYIGASDDLTAADYQITVDFWSNLRYVPAQGNISEALLIPIEYLGAAKTIKISAIATGSDATNTATVTAYLCGALR